MTSAFFIYIKDPGIAKTVASIDNNCMKVDKIVFLTNLNTIESERNIIDSIFKSCCGENKLEISAIDNFTIKTIDNLVHIHSDKSSKEELLTFAIKNINSDIALTAKSSEVFASNYIYKVLNVFNDNSIGVVYTDYFENGIAKHLEYLQPMITGKIPIKEFAIRSKLLEKHLSSELFETVVELFNKSIIKHLPEELYAV